jgi:hypothetical protein
MPFALEPPRSSDIGNLHRIEAVMIAIELDDQVMLRTEEVDDVRSNGHLPPEPASLDAGLLQPQP